MNVIDISDTIESTAIIECIEFNHFKKRYDEKTTFHFDLQPKGRGR